MRVSRGRDGSVRGIGDEQRALGVEKRVETTLYAPPDARIVLHRATKRIWIDGVHCAALTDTHFRLLEILITQSGQPVFTKDIAAHVARGKQHDDTTRKAIESFVAGVEKTFKAMKKKPPKDLHALIAKPSRSHYAIDVRSFID